MPAGLALPCHGWVSSSTPAAASPGHSSDRRPPPRATATPSGPRNSRALAVPSGNRATAAMKSMVMPPVTTPRATTASNAGRRNRQGRGRTTTSRIRAAQAIRSQTAPSGPTSPNRWTDSARPSCTQLIEPSAIKVPDRAEARGTAAMLTMIASTRHRDHPCPRDFDGHTVH
jgi:hypothetical protein